MIRGVRGRDDGWAGLVCGGTSAPDDPLVRVSAADEARCREVVEAAAHLPRIGAVTAGELARWSRSRLVGIVGEHRVDRRLLGALLDGVGLDGQEIVDVRAGVLGPLGHDVPVVAVVSARGSLVLARTLERMIDPDAVLRMEAP